MNDQSETNPQHEQPYNQGVNPHREQLYDQGVNPQHEQQRTNLQHEMNPYPERPYNQEMNMQSMEHNPHAKQMYDTCKKFHLYFVQIQTTEGQMYDGIIEDVDNEGVTMLIPDGDMERGEGMERQFGFGYGGYGFPRRFRRFRRFRFPFFLLSSLFFPYYY
ncbi:hypothetical protein [Oceanobacillus sp. CFH 90083]|uniref:hypothetical protein n=1 Tax=Oceanobacillus sp. CFH 90083 TaxID=2592336 RepID=UPI00128B9BA5|nr:hypothetical protein [Oceanobacillus sp. CFH 90083]